MKIRMRDGTGTIDLKFLVEDYDRHGNVRLYVRRHGSKIRIRETPGTDEFLAAYRAALAGAQPPSGGKLKPDAIKVGSLRWLVEHYYQSAEYRHLGKGMRRVLVRHDQSYLHGRRGRGLRPSRGPHDLRRQLHVGPERRV